jgi:hypothetical protein
MLKTNRSCLDCEIQGITNHIHIKNGHDVCPTCDAEFISLLIDNQFTLYVGSE